MAPLKVLIVGAGIAGNATAFWLAKLGHNVTVIERHHELRVNGLQLDLRGKGIEVMRKMGLEAAVRAKCVPEKGMQLVDGRGRQRAWFPANRSGKGAQSITSEFEIMRGDLCRLIYDVAVERGAKYRFGVSVRTYEETAVSSKVSVGFTDGTTEVFDLVVGCDGQGSKIRRLMLSDGDPTDVFPDPALTVLPERLAYFTMADPIREGEEYIATAYGMTERRTLLLRRHRDDMVQVYMMAHVNSGSGQLKTMERGDVKAEKEAFASLYEGGAWRTEEAVEALRHGADDFYCQYSGVVKLENWSRGRVTLVGDAGYGTPPDGMGTSIALLGAYILAGEISKSCGRSKQDEKCDTTVDGVVSAIEAYEAIFKPCLKKHTEGYSDKPGLADKISWGSWTVSLFYLFAGFASLVRLDKLLMKMMPDGGQGWEVPEYSSMTE